MATAGGSLAYLAAVARFAADLAAARPGAARAGRRGRDLRRQVAPRARRRRRAARRMTWPRRCRRPCRAAGRRAPGDAAGRRPGCAGRRRRAGPPARVPAAREAGPDSGAPSDGRTIRAGPDHDPMPASRWRRREDEAEVRPSWPRELDAWRDGAGSRRPGADLLPARRAGRGGIRPLAGRVRAAVRRRPQPDGLAADIWAGHGAGRRAGSARRRPGGGAAGRAGRAPRGCSASWRTRCARPPRPWSSWIRRARSGSSRRPGRCWPAPGSACCCPTGCARPGSG